MRACYAVELWKAALAGFLHRLDGDGVWNQRRERQGLFLRNAGQQQPHGIGDGQAHCGQHGGRLLFLFFAIISRRIGKNDVCVIGVFAGQRRTHHPPAVRPCLSGLHYRPTEKRLATGVSYVLGDRNRFMRRRNVKSVDRHLHHRRTLKKHVQRNPSWGTTCRIAGENTPRPSVSSGPTSWGIGIDATRTQEPNSIRASRTNPSGRLVAVEYRARRCTPLAFTKHNAPPRESHRRMTEPRSWGRSRAISPSAVG